MEDMVQELDVVFEEYERAVFLDEVSTCYAELNKVYQALHDGHSPAYRSGSALYFGETLPWPVFVVITLSLGVLAQLRGLADKRARVLYALLKDRARHVHVDAWHSKHEVIDVE